MSNRGDGRMSQIPYRLPYLMSVWTISLTSSLTWRGKRYLWDTGKESRDLWELTYKESRVRSLNFIGNALFLTLPTRALQSMNRSGTLKNSTRAVGTTGSRCRSQGTVPNWSIRALPGGGSCRGQNPSGSSDVPPPRQAGCGWSRLPALSHRPPSAHHASPAAR